MTTTMMMKERFFEKVNFEEKRKKQMKDKNKKNTQDAVLFSLTLSCNVHMESDLGQISLVAYVQYQYT